MKRSLAVMLAFAAIPLCAHAQGFQVGRLPATSRDSFEVMYQNQAIGAFIITLNRVGENYLQVGEARLPRMGVAEIDSLVFSAANATPVSMSNHMSMQGMTGTSKVSVANGKATGTAQEPSPSGMRNITIDANVAAGVFGDGTEIALLPTLDFSDALTLNFQTFDGKTGATKANTLKVLGKETITVPAGTGECWHVQLVSDETVDVYVAVAEPRRIMLIKLEAVGMEMRRAK